MPHTLTRKSFQRLVERANSHVAALNSLPPDQALAYIQSAVAKSDTAYVIYRETGSERVAFGYMLVKGAKAGSRRVSRRGKVECLPARNRFEAEAMVDAYGDGSTVITDPAPVPEDVRPHLVEARAKLATEVAELDRLIASANANGDLVSTGSVKPEEIFANADIVHLLWQDGSQPHGVGRALGKGKNKLMLAVQSGRSIEAVTAALRCRDAEQAALIWHIYGDGRSGAGDELADPALQHASGSLKA